MHYQPRLLRLQARRMDNEPPGAFGNIRLYRPMYKFEINRKKLSEERA